MANTSLMGLMIGLVVVSLFAGLFGIAIVQTSDYYDVTPSGNISSYNKMASLQSDVEDIKGDLTSLKEKSGVLDILGSIFSNAYNVLIKIPAKAIGTSMDMIGGWFGDIGLGAGGDLLYAAAIIILTILIFMGVILTILLKTGGI